MSQGMPSRKEATSECNLDAHEPYLRTAALIGLFAVGYYYAGKFGLSLAFLHPSATPVWPPTGISLAVLLLFGYRLWPGVLLGAFVLNFTTAGSLATSAGIASGNLLEALIGAWLVNRYANGRSAFDHPQTIFRFVFLAAVLSTAVSATVGVTSLALGGFARWTDYSTILLTWWLGDMASNLILAPLLLVWSTKPLPHLNVKQIAEALALVLFALVVGQNVFGGWFSPWVQYPLTFLCLPPVLWAAYRFGRHGAVTTVFLVAATAVWGTLSGYGPFAVLGSNQSLVLLQGFMATLALTAIVLASDVSERRQSEQALRESSVQLERSEEELRMLNRGLEQRVAERTASLEESHSAHLRAVEARLALEEQLRQKERLSALGLATAKIVHEIGNPLNGISTTAQVLKRHFETQRAHVSAEIVEIVGGLQSEIDRLRTLLDDIRSFSSPNAQVLQTEPLNLATLAAEVLAQEQRSYHQYAIYVEQDLPADLPPVMADRNKITQVLLNLYKNAFEAMPGGGTLSVRGYGLVDDVCMEIVDTGTGIADGIDVFEPLTSTKSTGMGIGLAVVKQFVEAHGGTIGYASIAGKGTTFRVTLPVKVSSGEG